MNSSYSYSSYYVLVLLLVESIDAARSHGMGWRASCHMPRLVNDTTRWVGS
jgi:hypothetical protein